MEITFRGEKVRIATGGKTHDSDLPGIVFIHGSGMDRTTWQMQSRWFSHHGYRVAAIDLPGHGLSSGSPLETIEEMGEWTAAVIHELQLAPSHLVGFSLGTYVAIEAAAQDPTCASSLVLIGTAASMPVHPELLSNSYDDLPKASRLMTSWGIGSKAHRGGHRSPGTWLIGASMALIDRSPEHALGHDMAACNAYQNAVSSTAKVSVPVTFVLGTEDKMTPIKRSADLVAAAVNHTVVHMEEIGHMMPIEDPVGARDAIARAVGWNGERT
ncbi:MAG: pimeloyl-ACP methyl ester carboxylesterase [Verrucomicrobiales bacterium]|jgi:pimeloyl-ACP methyl ester carboxylesterase